MSERLKERLYSMKGLQGKKPSELLPIRIPGCPIHFKVRQDGKYTNSAFYTVYSVDWEGNRDVLGLYINSLVGKELKNGVW
nr:hypothetical protein [Belliella baltica]